MKISVKISSVLALVIIGLGASGGFFIYFSAQKSLQESIGVSQQLLAYETMDAIDRFLNERYLNIQTIAGEYSLEKLLKGENIRSEIVDQLKDFMQYTGPWNEVAVFDRDAILKAGTNENETRGNHKEHVPELEAIRQVLATGRVYYSDAIVSPETGKPTMLFAAPVRDRASPQQSIMGVAVAQLSWPAISGIVGSNEESVIMLHDKHGQLIAASDESDREQIFKESFINNPQVASALGGSALTSVGPGMMMSGGAMMPQGEKTGAGQPQGQALISAVPELGYLHYGGNGWAMSIETPTRVAFASATRSAYVFLALMALLSAALFIAMYALLQLIIVRPVADLMKVADIISRGDMTRRAEVKSKDEIGDLARSFNVMADKVREMYADMEKKVEEKTRELGKKVAELEKTNRFMVDREVRMAELKKEIETLRGENK